MDIESFAIGMAVGAKGGGGGSSWTLIGSDEFEVSTTSTSQSNVGTINLDVESILEKDVFLVSIRDKAGIRNGYFSGADILCVFTDSNTTGNYARLVFSVASDGTKKAGSTQAGVYPYTADRTNKQIIIASKYSSTYGTVDGTYKVEVYKLPQLFEVYE